MGKVMFMKKGEVHTTPNNGIVASDIAVGSSVYLMENGTAVEYLVVNQGIPSDSSLYDTSCDGMWLLRKDCYSKITAHTATNDYQNSNIHSLLNGEFLACLGATEQAVIKQVKIPYVNGYGNAAPVTSGENGLSTKIFLLGCYEVGITSRTSTTNPEDGAQLEFFLDGTGTDANNIRIANLDGSSVTWWLRSPHTSNSSQLHYINTSGGCGRSNVTASHGIRPALILPSSALFDKETLLFKGVN